MELTNDVKEKSLESLIKRERQERQAMGAPTKEILSKLNISIDNMPQRCQQLLLGVCTLQASLGMEEIDPVTVSLYKARALAEKVDDDYQIMKLKQDNKKLQKKMNNNKDDLQFLKQDHAKSRRSLASQTPSPDAVQEQCRLMKQKVASYEESLERARAKFSSLSVPGHTMPKALAALVLNTAELSSQADALQRAAEEVALVNQARQALQMLKK